MIFARPVAILIAALALASPAGAHTYAGSGPPAGPKDLRAFLLRSDESAGRTFSRTPSMAWSPVRGAKSYEFELATSPKFPESAVLWSLKDFGTPAVAIPLALPWITGFPYSLYAHVRALTKSGYTSWSAAYGFNMRWPDAPKQMPGSPGLVRWTPIAGATGYEVLWVNAGHKRFSTSTNVADEREYYQFHQNSSWSGLVQWRVRAVRRIYGKIPNALPAVTYGPWSPTYSSLNPAITAGPLTVVSAVSDVTSDALKPQPHELTPGFTFSGNQDASGAVTTELSRVYISTDKDCVNVVFRGAIVASPAYAPRTTGPLNLPKNRGELAGARLNWLKDGTEGKTWTFDSAKVESSEAAPAADASTGTSSGLTGDVSATVTAGTVDLWDSYWPSGRYYWTVVPVSIGQDRENPTDPEAIEYDDVEQPQDACAAGRLLTFGKTSKPVVAASGAPYASGLSPQGRLTAAVGTKPKFYGTPLVAWEPALGADSYQVEWSRTKNPWIPMGNLQTDATSAMLCQQAAPATGATPTPAPAPAPATGSTSTSPSVPAPTPVPPLSGSPADTCKALGPGMWYYRVRGLDYALPKKPGMTWSEPATLVVTKPSFVVVGKKG